MPLPHTGADPPTFADLLHLYASPEDPAEVEEVSLSWALTGGHDPRNVLAYYASLGLPVRSLADLLAINDDPGEDDVHAFPTREGVAVSIASDCAWVHFVP